MHSACHTQDYSDTCSVECDENVERAADICKYSERIDQDKN